MNYKEEIFDKWVDTNSFYDLLDEYIAFITSCEWDKVTVEFKEFLSTLMPLRTFLKNNDYGYVWVSSKNSIRDQAKIDAEVWNGESIHRIQITLATENHNDFKNYFHQMEELYSCDFENKSKVEKVLSKEDVDLKLRQMQAAIDRKKEDVDKYDFLLIGLMDNDIDNSSTNKISERLNELECTDFVEQIFIAGITRHFYRNLLKQFDFSTKK